MTAAEEFLRGLAAAGGWIDGNWEIPDPTEPDESPRPHTTCTCTREEAS